MKLEIIAVKGNKSVLPKFYVSPIIDDLCPTTNNSLSNFTKEDSDASDGHAGTLSIATLQCIIEYLTSPGEIIFSWNAHFGAIYRAANNCGQFVFGLEG